MASIRQQPDGALVHSQDWYTTHYADDVVEHLTNEHDEIRLLMGRVLPASGSDRVRAVEAVRELLTRHEAAEAAVLRPLVRSLGGGEAEAAERTREEDRVLRMLRRLEQLDVGSIPFSVLFRELEEAVSRHLENEQTTEFTLLRRGCDPETLRRARLAVEEFEAGESPGSDHVHGLVPQLWRWLARHVPHRTS
jgi:hypothetical protein